MSLFRHTALTALIVTADAVLYFIPATHQAGRLAAIPVSGIVLGLLLAALGDVGYRWSMRRDSRHP